MYSQILDQQTYQAVVSAAPDSIPGEYDSIARDVVNTLEGQAYAAEYYLDEKDQPVWHMSITELARCMSTRQTPSMVGRVLGEMGLLKSRKRDGFHLYWNKAQLDILRSALLGGK